MAFLPVNDKLIDQQDSAIQTDPLPGSTAAVASGTDPASTVSGQSSTDAGNGVSTAGVGAGGTGGWTNIQAYLNANKGDTSTADNLNNIVGGNFDTEEKNLNDTTSNAVSQAKSQSDTESNVKNNYGDILNQASSAYDWNNPSAANPYQQQLSDAYSSQYSAPKNVSDVYSGFGADAQKYGADLNDDNSFYGLLGDQATQRAGGQYSSGQRELQKQFDINNDAVSAARDQLLNRWSGLQNEQTKTISDSNDELNNYYNQFNTDQNAYKDAIGSTQNGLTTGIKSAENADSSKYNDYVNQLQGTMEASPSAQLAAINAALAAQNTRYRNDFGNSASDELGQNGLNMGAADGGLNLNQTRAAIATLRQQAIDQGKSDYASSVKGQSDPDKAKFNVISSFLGGNPYKQNYNVQTNSDY